MSQARMWMSRSRVCAAIAFAVATVSGCTTVDSTDVTADIEAMWDFNDPAASEARFREALSEQASSINARERAEIFTQIARAQGLQRRFEEAHATLDRVEQMLEADVDAAHVRYALERGRVWNSSGEPQRARPMFVQAWESARQIGDDALAVDAAHMVAIVESGDEALRWNEEALALATESGNPRARKWTASLHNNIGWTYHERGDFDVALEHFQRALEARREAGDEKTTRIARWCVARCMRSLERVEDALAIQRDLERTPDPDGYVYEEIAECLLLLERDAEARPYFRKAHALLSKDPWLAESEPDRLARMQRLGGG